MGLKPTQKWLTLKTKGNSTIFGGCWAFKSGLRILVRKTKGPFFVPGDDHFWHFYMTKNGCRNKNSENTFISPTSPKNGGIAFGFKRLTLLGGF